VLGSAAVEAVEVEFEGPREHPYTRNEAATKVEVTSNERSTRPIICPRRGFIDLTLVSLAEGVIINPSHTNG